MKMPKEKSVVLTHGMFKESFFERLVEKDVGQVFVLESRPNFECSKSSVINLFKREIKPVMISDNMAGFLFYKNLVKEVWITYQKEESNNLLCPIGSLILAILAKKHKVIIHACPSDHAVAAEGAQKEIFYFNNARVAPEGIKGYVPLREEVPKKYISEVIA